MSKGQTVSKEVEVECFHGIILLYRAPEFLANRVFHLQQRRRSGAKLYGQQAGEQYKQAGSADGRAKEAMIGQTSDDGRD